MAVNTTSKHDTWEHNNYNFKSYIYGDRLFTVHACLTVYVGCVLYIRNKTDENVYSYTLKDILYMYSILSALCMCSVLILCVYSQMKGHLHAIIRTCTCIFSVVKTCILYPIASHASWW